MMTSAEIRQQFLDFFRSKGHVIVPSAPIVVKDDPTLMFTNAGMNQFKDYFLGNRPAPYKRIADTQKCLRVSGKHNDLEEVGVDNYHHTMFEMLGNWSFGDYFKEEAIEWSWELLTKVYKLEPDRLYATVFEGDEKEKLPASKIALQKWRAILPPDHIVFGNKKDNFWEMGETGPCGPCSEIHVDMRGDAERTATPGHLLVNKDHPEVIEIWNNVFIQFNRLKDGSLEPLPATHVDTGMGLERLVRVIQNKSSNYDTDVFTGTIELTETLTKKKYGRSDIPADIAFRVIADHIRAIAFTIADGQLPSNTGAGYVIRRILRRAVRYFYSYLDFKQPLLHSLIPHLARQFENVFPELIRQSDFVARVVREEEEAFLKTLSQGISRFSEYLSLSESQAKANADGSNDRYRSFAQQKVVAGDFAFELQDTFGFPIDLTALMARENNWSVDMEGYTVSLQKQKERSRASAVVETGDWTVIEEGSPEFVGYETDETETRVLKYRQVTSKGKSAYQVVLRSTPFYAESGGQVGDTGTFTFGEEVIEVENTKKENDLIIHFASSLPGNITGPVRAKIDVQRRLKIAAHHSATHLLHAALRTVLGTHVAQKGSLVNDEHLRFDFSHFSKVTGEEIRNIEHLVNEKIRDNIPVVIRYMHKDEAMKLGAMALFGEKYGDTVRVVTIDPSYSVELCGGTHVGTTGQLGFFKITHESAVAAGVRRIEAVTGAAAEQYMHGQLNKLEQINGVLNNPKDSIRAIETLIRERDEFARKAENFENRLLVAVRNELVQKDEIVNGVNFIGSVVQVSGPEALKKLCTDLKNNIRDHIVVLCTNVDGKAHVAVSVSETVTAAKNVDAASIIKKVVAPLIKGGGGGQKTFASAGGTDISRFEEVIREVRGVIK
jgi:alanyl-tRNA synthetase